MINYNFQLYVHVHQNHRKLLEHSKITPLKQLSILVKKLHTVMCDHRYSIHSPATIATSLFSLELEKSTHNWFPLTSAQHTRVKVWAIFITIDTYIYIYNNNISILIDFNRVTYP